MKTKPAANQIVGVPLRFIHGHNGGHNRKLRTPCACGCGMVPVEVRSRYVKGHARINRTPSQAYIALVLPRLIEGDCHIFDGCLNNKGYGTVRYGGRSSGRLVLAHRVTYEHWHGPIPKGLEVMHTCDRPACCNPNHLVLGTHAENMADMRRKGRGKGQRRVTFCS